MAASGAPLWRRILVRVAVAGVAALVFFGVSKTSLFNGSDALDKYEPGDCLTLAQDGINVADTESACDVNPSYTVASRNDGDGACANENYTTYELTSDGDTVAKLCLIENLVAGDCYQPEMVSSIIEKIDCAQASAMTSSFVVSSRADNADGVCAGQEVPIVYPEPAPGRTYCTDIPV